MKRRFICYTDGSAVANKNSENYRLGGFGVYMKIEEDGVIVRELFFNGGFSNTKTGRMELTAAITALHKIKDKLSQVFIYSDSQYVTDCINLDRLWNWEKNNWQGLKNIDLLKRLFEEFKKFRRKPIFIHIKGHQKSDDDNVIGNNIADRLADYHQFKTYKKDEYDED